MEYDVEEYVDLNGVESVREIPAPTWKHLYAITADGQQIGLNLPAECDSLEVGREFLAWEIKRVERTGLTTAFKFARPAYIEEKFTEFLEQRKQEAEAEESSPDTLDADPSATRNRKRGGVMEQIGYYISIVNDAIANKHPVGDDWAFAGLSLAIISAKERDKVRKHFEVLGHEVKYEMRLNSGQRLRGFWIKELES